MKSTASLAPGHQDWLDLLRVISAFAVVLLHLSACLSQQFGCPGWLVGEIYDALTRWCVPIFVMVSGALLLDDDKRNESALTFYSKRLSRLGWAFVFWVTFYVLFGWADACLFDRPHDFHKVFQGILTGRPWSHLSFLYMIIGLYLVVPLLRRFVLRLEDRTMFWLIAAFLIATSANNLRAILTNKAENPFILWFADYLGYFLAGYYLRFRAKKILPGWSALTIFMATVILSVTATSWVLFTDGRLEFARWFHHYQNPCVMAAAISLFMLAMQSTVPAWTATIAPLTFGIYLVHPAVQHIIGRLGFYPQRFMPALLIPLLAAVTAVISIYIVRGIRKTPFFRKTV
ncbi:MAG: acyltransferase family protein [Candidatus Pacebacteria bacterium]|nr:acyltransferase family protein [Candidatus Paceibacterota bacterium]